MIKTILIVDDHPLYLSGLKTTLEGFDFEKRLLTADSYHSAKNLLISEQIDLVFLDVQAGNGIHFLNEPEVQALNTKFIMLSMYHDAASIREALASGANGFLSKDASKDEIRLSAKTVLEGGTFFNASVTLSLVYNMPLNPVTELINLLTPTEKRILNLIAKSYSSKEIAEMLSVNFRTVENHRSNICGKLNLSGSNSLVKFALTNKSFILP